MRTSPPTKEEDLIRKHYIKINKPTLSGDEVQIMKQTIRSFKEKINQQRDTLDYGFNKLKQETSELILNKYEIELFVDRLIELINDMSGYLSINPETWETYKKIASHIDNILDAFYADKEVQYTFTLMNFSKAIGNIDETLHQLVSKLNQYDYSRLE